MLHVVEGFEFDQAELSAWNGVQDEAKPLRDGWGHTEMRDAV